MSTTAACRDAGDHPNARIEIGPTDQIFERPADSRTDDYIRGRFG